ncbi:MAG: ATP-binding protein, partial [Dehalococcoidia bacterium]
NINVTVKTTGRERRLDSEVETGLFRVAQGSIGNIIEHSKAKNSAITVEYGDSELVLRITDDGQGFDVADITDVEESGRGRGLFSMRERIMLLGGTASVDSKIGQGTTVRASVPIGQGEENEHE